MASSILIRGFISDAGGGESKNIRLPLLGREPTSSALRLLSDSDEPPDFNSTTDEKVRPFVEQFINEYVQIRKKVVEACWKYETTKDEKYEVELGDVMKEYEAFILPEKEKLNKMNVRYNRIGAGKLRYQYGRVFHLVSTFVPIYLSTEINEIVKQADEVYYNDTYATRELLKLSDDSRELANAWTNLVQNTGRKIAPLFSQYFEVLKKVVKFVGFSYPSHFLSFKLRIGDWMEHKYLSRRLYYQFYELHTLLRYFLHDRLKRGPRAILRSGDVKEPKIQIYEWGRLNEQNDALIPFSGIQDIIKQAVHVKSSSSDWLELANIYYHESMGFDKLLNISDIRSKLVPLEATATTSATSRKNLVVYNFLNGDYRISWTPGEIEENMFNMFKVVGYVHNLEIWQLLNPIHQGWTNEVFGDAIVGAASLSAFSPSGLTKLGILTSSNVSEFVIVNRQLKSILYYFSTVQLGLVTDFVTLEMYHEDFPPDQYNSKWWKRVVSNLDIDSRGDDFAAGTIEHLLDGTVYIKEALREVLKYQFFQRLCVVAGQFDPLKPEEQPLYKCDLSGNKEAQTIIQFAMQQGNALSWNSMMMLMTGTEEIEVEPLMNYYLPLKKWLRTVVRQDVINLIAKKVAEHVNSFFYD